MNTTSPSREQPRFSIGEAKERLKTAIERAFAGPAPPVTADQPLRRIEIPLRPVAQSPILLACRGAQRTYWSSRGGALECVGLGCAETLAASTREEAGEVFARMRQMVCAGAGVRYYGGMRFDPTQTPRPHWRPFGLARFVLPRFEVLREKKHFTLACNLVWKENDNPALLLPKLLMELASLRLEPETAGDGITSGVGDRRDEPSESEWAPMLGEAMQRISRGDLQKIVLARESRFTFDNAPDGPALLQRLIGLTRDSYHFCFETPGGAAFLGASPERLYRREGRRIYSEAVAGTRPRGRDGAEEADYARALLESGKDRHEHALVMDALRDAFSQLCSEVEPGDEVSVLKLHCCQHLYWPIEGTLKAAGAEAHILRLLHPTPAVGGTPTADAVRAIGEIEPFDRGWYTGPVGWIGADGAEFAVAIRSGLLADGALHLYSGAGIVPESVAAEEWAEIENKMGTFIQCLGAAHD